MSKLKKIILIASATLISLLILIVAGYFASVLYIERPKVIDKFWDLSLGMSVNDLKFNKGEPFEIGECSWSEKCERWQYKWKDNNYYAEQKYDVIIKDGKIVAIIDELGFTRHLNSQSLHTSEDIISRYGTPSNISIHSGQTARLYSFNKYKVVFYLTKNEIQFYGIYDPDSITPHFKEEEAK